MKVRESASEFDFLQTRQERLRFFPFITLYLALWRRLRYFFTFKTPLFNETIEVMTFWGLKVKCSVYDLFHLAQVGYIPGEEKSIEHKRSLSQKKKNYKFPGKQSFPIKETIFDNSSVLFS